MLEIDRKGVKANLLVESTGTLLHELSALEVLG